MTKTSQIVGYSSAFLVSVGCGSSGGSSDGVGGGHGGFSSNRDDFFGDSRCHESLAFCEDFERGNLEGYETLGDSVGVDDTRAARGTRALHLRAEGSLDVEILRISAPFPLPRNTHYLRLFVYFESLPRPPMDVNGWSLAWAQSPIDAQYARVGGQFDGTDNVFATGSAEPSITLRDDDPTGSPRAVPTGEWICLEWLNDGVRDEQHLFWDATEHPSLTLTPRTPSTVHPGIAYRAPEFDFLDIGWIGTVNEPIDLWIDEIAIDGQRIGCER